MAPVILEALRHANLTVTLIATGQHDGLFDDAIAGFGIKPDAHLGAAPGAPVETLRKYIARWLAAHRPDIVLVQGDTNSALAGAQAAYGLGIPVGHVEAGLRTHTPLRPFPEENNRVAIAQLAALHFAPSLLAADNLRAENVRGAIHITGNPGIDALMQTTATFSLPPVQTGHHILITCHRREIFGAP
ncbi:MAG: UDP-N-acetylglucosamine 2-epimerase, partial [Alphaproteobacteria bacterium]|nr:UDP-N-acetylglucosamine 2-epimerase [Alphaproteobacteria bacterium]